ncbi:hypothetical protein EDB86DRAFT_2930892 [Lactarius hatsudake]|nr:hypothetical protein EDB86DRAFT_2930892 [Lactarius hatsudake]
MLAAISPSAHNMSPPIPYAHSPTSGPSLLDSGSPVENKICPGCHLTVMDENGGVVIAFGQSFFHIDCFKCAKCHDRVTADTNLLLLSDGQPVCSNCSYSCSVCHEPILDEAIMTGDDSYHAHCFKCRSCHNRIDELMFAKTSHGIYCMKCHHQRVARSRRHAQKQKEREYAATAGGPSKSHGRLTKEQSGLSANTPVGPFTPDSALSSLPTSAISLASQASPTRPIPPGFSESGDNYRPQARSSLNGRPSVQLERDGRRSAPHTPTVSAPSSQRTSRNALPSPTSPSLSSAHTEPAPSRHSTDRTSPAIVVPAEPPEAGPPVSMSHLQREPSNEGGARSSFLSPDVPAAIERRKSYDDGTRPLNILFKNDAPPTLNQSLRLSDRASKRNSINPATTFNYEAMAAEYKPTSAPDSPLSNVPPTSDTGLATIRTDTRPLPSNEQAVVELSSQPTRKARADAPDAPSATDSRSRSRTESSPKLTTSVDSVRPPLRQNMMLERIPPRTHSLNTTNQDLQAISRRLPPVASVKNGTSGRPSSDEKDKFKHGSSLSIDVEKSRVGYGKRPMSPAHKATSPAHKVDVPRGIESGTDTSDGEREPGADEQNIQPLPPNRKETKSRPRPMQLDLDVKRTASQDESGDTSFLSSAGGDVDSEEESSPVERVSRSTFIAPAHPPIRVSISANGFQELLSLVDPRNRSSLQSIEELVKLNQDAAARLDSSRSSSSLNLDSNVAQSEGRGSNSPAGPTTPTTLGSLIADSASVTTISPNSHSHGDNFMVTGQHEGPNGVVSDSPPRQLAVHDALPTSSNGHPSDVFPEQLASGDQRVRLDSTASRHTDTNELKNGAHITITAPDSSVLRLAKSDPSYMMTKTLRDTLQEAARRSTTQITLDQEFVQAIIVTIEQRRDEHAQMKGKLDHIKRASKHAMDGLTVAHEEYESELKARREAEAEVTRLRVLLSGQAARITALAGEGRKDELHRQLTRELSDSLSVLEQDVSKLKVERDLALVEMEEIASTRSLATLADREDVSISSSLSTRLDDLKAQYQGELVSLTDERESLLREIAELRSARDVFLEETTMLNERNEELAQLNAHYMRRIEVASSEPLRLAREKPSLEHQRPAVVLQSSHTANSSFGTFSDESADSTKYPRAQKPPAGDPPMRVFKWRGNAKEAAATASAGPDSANEKSWLKHTFQHANVLRLTKCDHCGDKLWGSQLRCPACHLSIHPRCQQHVQVICSPQSSRRDEGVAVASLQPSMFGRELTEQVRADSRITDKMAPLLVEKCIAAVETTALDYEGIYRKTGGAGQSKLITQLFERGDYSSFDLLDTERFNDIGSVTSVLKSYFRTLPNPLLTFVLHDEFIFASSLQDPVHKSSKYADLVKQLPTEHYYTLRMLMLHLHRFIHPRVICLAASDMVPSRRVQEHHKQNLMTARNLGVVFGRSCRFYEIFYFAHNLRLQLR